MADSSAQDPKSEYLRRLALRREGIAVQERRDRGLAALRLAIVLAAVAVALVAFRSSVLSAWWLTAPLICFVSLLPLHERVRARRRRLERAADYYDRGIARIEDRWQGSGATGERFLDTHHPYAVDLDLFGKGSLFELVSLARTRMGERTIASWLTSPAPPEEIHLRQDAAEELRARLDLREEMAVLGKDIHAGVQPEALASWGEAPPMLHSRLVPAAASALSAATILALIFWLIRDDGVHVFLLLALAEAVFLLGLQRQIRRVLQAVEAPAENLELLSQALHRTEAERFRTERLTDLHRTLAAEDVPASRRIARLHLLVVMQKQLFAPLAWLLLWDIHAVYAIEAWRRRSGPHVARWLDVVGEMEALCSLGAYAYEHPGDALPEIVHDGPCYEGSDLGHPLLPAGACVRNAVSLNGGLRVLVVSGSNMSGKSTLLRTVGINAVLAWAGGRVRATRLRISPLAVGASIQRRDSLQEGTSRFYAEITRLRQMSDLADGARPLLFLLDELLHGTNSHDRLIGSEAVVRDLVRRGAIGLLTTHDLALAAIAEVLAPQAENVHFQDSVENGRLVFDYRLRPGVVRRSNALELMRSIGLQV
jgi:hypothetical protein